MNTPRRLAATILAPLILLTAAPSVVRAEFRSFDDIAAAYLDARDKYAPLFPPILPLPVETLVDMSLAGDFSFTENPDWFHVRPDGPFPFRARSRDFRGLVNDTLLLVFEDIASGRIIILNEWAQPMAVYKAPPWPLMPDLDAERGHRAWELEFMRRRLSWWIFLDNTPPEPDPPPVMMMMGQGEPDPDEIRFTAISDVNVQPLEMMLRLEYGSNRVDETWAVFSADWMPTGGWPEGPPGPWERASEPWTLAAGTNEWVWTDEGQLDRELFTNVPLRVYAAGSLADSDGDGLADGDEWFIYGTDPFNADTDGDWFSDGYEIEMGYDPHDPLDNPGLVMVINGGASHTANTNLLISFPGLVADTVEIGETADLSDSIMQGFGDNLPYSLKDDSNGLRRVYARLWQDTESSPIMQRYIILDTMPPEILSVSPTNGYVTNRRWIKLTGEVTDAVSQVRVFVNDQWAHGGSEHTFWHDRIMLQSGTNEFVIRAEDLAGNMTNKTVHIIQDTTGDTTAPALEIFLPGQSVDTNGYCSALYGDAPELYFSGWTDDETAQVLIYSIADSVTNGPWEAVVVGTQVWGYVGLMPGTNLIWALARDAAGNTTTAACHAVRDMDVVFRITDPAPYQVMNAASSVVAGIASPMFSNATITVNNVATSIVDQGDHVTFSTVVGVPLNAGRTEIVGKAEGVAFVYYTDPTTVGYELKSLIMNGTDVHIGTEVCVCYTWSGDSSRNQEETWDSESKVFTGKWTYDSYTDCLYYTCGESSICSTTPPPYEISYYTEFPSNEWVSFSKIGTTIDGDPCWWGYKYWDQERKSELQYVKHWHKQESQMVILQFPNMRMHGGGGWGFSPNLVEDPSVITYRGQTGFWHNGHVSFIVPIMTDVEFTIKESDFTWPSYHWPINVPYWGTGYEEGRSLWFRPNIDNDVLKVEIKAGDGSGEPSAFLSPGSTTNFTAIVTPNVPGTFVWSVNDEERLQLASTTGSTVTVTVPADAEASAEIGAETLTVTFTPTGHDHSIEATHALTVIKVELTSIDDYNSWMPELNNTIRFMANIQPPNLQGFFDFRLTDVSQHPGYCMNAPNPVPNSGKHSASWNDLRFLTPQPGISVSGSQDNIGTSTIKNSEQEIVIISHDYASWGNLRCTAEIGISPGNAMFFDAVFSVDGKSFAEIPKDDNDNDIADAWEHSSGAPTDDLDEFPGLSGNPNIGDGLSRFQEYRGFLTAAGPVERLNPGRPNLFVWNKDQLPVTEFASASKLDLVLIAGAGHDATKRVNFATGGQPGRPDYHLKNQYAVTLIRIPGLGGGLWDSTTLEASVGEDQHPAGIVRVTGHELGHAVNLKHHHADPVFSSDEDRRYNGPACYMKYSCSFEDYLPQNLVFCACATPSPGCTNFEDVTPCYPGEHPLTTTDCLSGRCACILKIKVNPINKWNVNFPD